MQNKFWSPLSLFLLQYSDNYYKAALIDAAAATITPAITTVTITGYIYFSFNVFSFVLRYFKAESHTILLKLSSSPSKEELYV